MTAGTLILLFVAYQLWGTGLQEASAQRSLEKELAAQLARVEDATTTSTTAATTTTTAPVDPAVTTTTGLQVTPVTAPAPVSLDLPDYGDAMAKIRIPKIGITRTVVEGAGLDQLKRGPGHLPETPLPGQAGNVAIAGHRTTYGQPFHNIDKLEMGDQIQVETIQGNFVYEIDSIEIVDDEDVSVLADQGDNRLTLVACHPKYSLAQRYIVSGTLEGTAVPPIVGQEEARKKAAEESGNVGKGGDPFAPVSLDGAPAESKTPAILWGLVCALIWLATWAVTVVIRRRTDRTDRRNRALAWSPYLVGVPVFLVALYVFFENFALLLPGSY